MPRHPPPEIACTPLSPYDRTVLGSIRAAFRDATPIPLQQGWTTEPERGFAPGVVRTGWTDRTLLVLAELTDEDIFNRATELNQRAWELGDVFEIFLGPADGDSYTELHVTPENQHLQLRFPDRQAIHRVRETGRLDDLMIWTELFTSTTWIEPGVWHVFAEVPAQAPLEDTQWRFSFSRYDYTRGVDEPVISSTSPHREKNFHCQDDWGRLLFRSRSAT